MFHRGGVVARNSEVARTARGHAPQFPKIRWYRNRQNLRVCNHPIAKTESSQRHRTARRTPQLQRRYPHREPVQVPARRLQAWPCRNRLRRRNRGRVPPSRTPPASSPSPKSPAPGPEKSPRSPSAIPSTAARSRTIQPWRIRSVWRCIEGLPPSRSSQPPTSFSRRCSPAAPRHPAETCDRPVDVRAGRTPCGGRCGSRRQPARSGRDC